METIVTPATYSPQARRTYLLSVAPALLLALGACGVVDYDLGNNRFSSAERKSKDLGTIHFHYADGESYSVHVRRIGGGHAMLAPIYDSEHGSQINFVTSQTSERKFFVGVESRFSF